MTLFDQQGRPQDVSREWQHRIDTRLDAAFKKFHADNPVVYDTLVALAREARAAGRAHVGIKMLWEVMRWQMFLRTTGDDFKLNNNYPSRYARLIMEQEPDLEGLFDLRTLRS